MPFSVPSHESLLLVFGDESKAITYLIEHGVLSEINSCTACGSPLTLHGLSQRCKKEGCRKRHSVTAGTFFAGARVPINKLLLIAYLWACRCSYTSIYMMVQASSATIVAYLGHLRELVGSTLEEEDVRIGGPGIIVEVDESKFGRRKYNRGHRVAGAWVLGGIEITEAAKFFVKVISWRDAETLLDCLSRYILTGSIIHTDCWRGYAQLGAIYEVEHKMVNHSVGFVDYDTGVHTNKIEAKWAALKNQISLRSRTADTLDGHLLAEIWRKKSENDLWGNLLDAMRTVKYD
jgi:transposase-like protein